MSLRNSVNMFPLPAGPNGTLQMNTGNSFTASKAAYYEVPGQGTLEVSPGQNNVALNLYSSIGQRIRLFETTTGVGETLIDSNINGLTIDQNNSIVLRSRSNPSNNFFSFTSSTGNVVASGTITGSNLSGTNTGNQTITLTGDVTGGGAGSFAATIGANVVTASKFRQSVGLAVVGRSTNTTGDVADITAGLDFQVLRRSGSGLAFGAVDLSQSAAVTNTLSVSNGGTGSSTQNFVDLSNNQTIGGTKTFGSTIAGSINGNAGTAATWQTGRTLTIGGTGKSVNGSVNVSWSLIEIGAADRTLVLTGGDGMQLIGDLTANRTVAVDSTVIRTTGNQTIVGTKTFSSPVIVATPTIGTHAVTKDYVDKHKCILTLPSAQSIPNATATVFYSLNFGTSSTLYDPIGMHSETINNSRITFQKTATFKITIFARWADFNSTGYRILQAKLNDPNASVGAGVGVLLEPASIGVQDSTAGRCSQVWVYYRNFTAGDYINIVVGQNTGAPLNMSSLVVEITEV